MTMENFDYDKAVAELDALAARVEDPATGIGDIDKCLERADVLVRGCREYLRSVRDKLDNIDNTR